MKKTTLSVGCVIAIGFFFTNLTSASASIIMYEDFGSIINLFPEETVPFNELLFGYDGLIATNSVSYSGDAVADATMGAIYTGPRSIGLNPRFRINVYGIGQANIHVFEQAHFTITNTSDNNYYGDSTRKFGVKFGLYNDDGSMLPPRDSATGSVNIIISSDDIPGYNVDYTRSDSCTPTHYYSVGCRQEEDFGLNFWGLDIAAHQTVNILMSVEYAAEARVVSEPSPITVFMAGLAGLVGISTLRSRRATRRNRAA